MFYLFIFPSPNRFYTYFELCILLCFRAKRKCLQTYYKMYWSFSARTFSVFIQNFYTVCVFSTRSTIGAFKIQVMMKKISVTLYFNVSLLHVTFTYI